MELSPSRAVNDLHSRMINKFVSKQVEQDKKNAFALQDFFQALKNRESLATNSDIDFCFIDQIKQTIKQYNPRINIEKMFYHQDWKTFEKEIARIQGAVSEVVGGPKLSNALVKTQMTGKDVRLDQVINLDKISPEILKQIGIKYCSRINGFGLQEYYIPGGQQIKVDNKNLMQIQISSNASSYAQKIYSLLREATFTAKNYSSQNNYRSVFENLTLGKTKIGTILIDILPYLVGNKWENYLRVLALNQDNPDVLLHIQHLRQAYELVGLGQQSNSISRENGGAKYLIYNDPSTNLISVKATSEIVNNILDSKFYRYSGFDNYITEISRDLSKIISTYDKTIKF